MDLTNQLIQLSRLNYEMAGIGIKGPINNRDKNSDSHRDQYQDQHKGQKGKVTNKRSQDLPHQPDLCCWMVGRLGCCP